MQEILNEINKAAFIIAPVFYKIIFMSATASLAGVFVLISGRLFDKYISPVWKYIMWGIVLTALIIPYRPQSSFSVLKNAENIQDISYRKEYDDIKEELHKDSSYNLVYIQELKREKQKIYLQSAIFDFALPVIWVIGIFGFLFYFLISRIIFTGNIKISGHENENITLIFENCCEELNIKRKIPVYIKDISSTPGITGVISPKILLPSYSLKMDDNELRYVILHELGHYKRGDLLLNELLLILQCVYWFNPVIYYIFKHIRTDMEVMNDSYIVKRLGDKQSKDYARSLVSVLGHSNNIKFTPKMVCMSDGAKNVERRIYMIKLKERFRKHRILVAGGCIFIMIIVSLLFLTTGKYITDEEALSQLENSIEYREGVLNFRLPENYPSEKWNILVSGRTEYPDGMSMSTHPFEGIDWKSGLYTIQIENQYYTDLNMDITLSDKINKSINLMDYIPVDDSLKAISFENNESFKVAGKFPSDWSVTVYDEKVYIPGNFEGILSIYAGDIPVAAIGYSQFEPYTEEISQEDYYKTVYSDLRLNRMFLWDPYHPVKTNDNIETALTDVWYLDPDKVNEYMGRLPDCPSIETRGILTYNKSVGIYVGIIFDKDVLDKYNLSELAESIEIVKSEK